MYVFVLFITPHSRPIVIMHAYEMTFNANMQNRFLKPRKPPEIKRVEKYDDDDNEDNGNSVDVRWLVLASAVTVACKEKRNHSFLSYI